MPRLNDTIAALATPVGTAAVAVLRVSGPDAAGLARDIFGSVPPPRRFKHGDYRAGSGTLLDDVLYVFFEGPRSYTGEDALEISCHGNPFIAQKILEDLLTRGCRPAEPGEFTQRAFLNGRMDLSQAEAVMDLIHARSERALAMAQQQLRGALGRRLDLLANSLLGVLAQIEAYIDFPEEDLPPENRGMVAGELERIAEEVGRLLATSHYGELIREGIKTVIIGAPNAGKSSLLNRLVGRERAIVSAEPGTTRDFIEERIMLDGHSLRLIDTAGLNPSPSGLEQLGMAKTLERAAEADIFLLVIDATHPVPALPAELMARLRPENTLVVLNKMDLTAGVSPADTPAGLPTQAISALTGLGLDKLIEVISRRASLFQQNLGEETIAINARHAHALARARRSLAQAREKIERGQPKELLASDIRDSLDALGEISGKIDNERMLDQLFAKFCIGK